MFWVLSQRAPENLPRFPLGLVDGVGDVVFLPAFNGFATYLGFWAQVERSTAAIGGIVALVITTVMTYMIVYKQEGNEWSRPEKGKSNMGTWYHALFSLGQSWILVTAFIIFPYEIGLYVLFGGYLLTFLHTALFTPF